MAAWRVVVMAGALAMVEKAYFFLNKNLQQRPGLCDLTWIFGLKWIKTLMNGRKVSLSYVFLFFLS